MWLLDVVLLVLLGVLGIASWLKSNQPKVAGQLGPIEGVAGWIGLIGLIWGIVLLLRGFPRSESSALRPARC
jgi:hypothetical protein